MHKRYRADFAVGSLVWAAGNGNVTGFRKKKKKFRNFESETKLVTRYQDGQAIYLYVIKLNL